MVKCRRGLNRDTVRIRVREPNGRSETEIGMNFRDVPELLNQLYNLHKEFLKEEGEA